MLIIAGLAAGWLALITINLLRGYSVGRLARFSFSGIRSASGVLVTLCIVGILTGLWRAAGTIPYIVSVSTDLISLRFLILEMFLLSSFVSFLIGTSFGTAATVGVISMIIAQAAGISPILAGGTILSGIFFGDRCSYISSSAMLVCSLTKTNIYDNVKGMLRTGAVPFGTTCIIYLIPGLLSDAGSVNTSSLPDFSTEFVLSPWTTLPAIIILVLAFFRFNVKLSMGLSSLAAICLCLLIQRQLPAEILQTMLLGFVSEDPALADLIDGGGLISMWKVLGIVCISSTYSGIFEGTGILDKITGLIQKLAQKTGRSACLLVLSLLTSMISCNQTLATMLTAQLGEKLYPDKQEFAIALENTVIVVSPLIPWCIAGAIPIAMLGAPASCLLTACYLYLLPLWEILRNRR